VNEELNLSKVEKKSSHHNKQHKFKKDPQQSIKEMGILIEFFSILLEIEQLPENIEKYNS